MIHLIFFYKIRQKSESTWATLKMETQYNNCEQCGVKTIQLFKSLQTDPLTGLYTCISTRITTGIHVADIIKLILTDIMSRMQFHSTKCLYLDMHGLIFEASISLLAGSTS